MALAERSGLRQGDLLEVLGLGAMASPMIALKGPAIMQRAYPPAFKLVSQQKDMRLVLALGCVPPLLPPPPPPPTPPPPPPPLHHHHHQQHQQQQQQQ